MSKIDVLRYLGYDGQKMDDALTALINKHYKAVEEIPGKYVYKVFGLEPSLKVKGTLLTLEGSSIKHLLSQSKKVILFAATLGSGVDKMLHHYSYTSTTDQMIYNACGSARIEEVLNKMTEEILNAEGGYLTPRFSPGYGDLLLSIHPQLLRILSAEKMLGISYNTSYLMTPLKSVSGIIGWSDNKMTVEYHMCDDCLKRVTCNFKICKRGV